MGLHRFQVLETPTVPLRHQNLTEVPKHGLNIMSLALNAEPTTGEADTDLSCSSGLGGSGTGSKRSYTCFNICWDHYHKKHVWGCGLRIPTSNHLWLFIHASILGRI